MELYAKLLSQKSSTADVPLGSKHVSGDPYLMNPASSMTFSRYSDLYLVVQR